MVGRRNRNTGSASWDAPDIRNAGERVRCRDSCGGLPGKAVALFETFGRVLGEGELYNDARQSPP